MKMLAWNYKLPPRTCYALAKIGFRPFCLIKRATIGKNTYGAPRERSVLLFLVVQRGFITGRGLHSGFSFCNANHFLQNKQR